MPYEVRFGNVIPGSFTPSVGSGAYSTGADQQVEKFLAGPIQNGWDAIGLAQKPLFGAWRGFSPYTPQPLGGGAGNAAGPAGGDPTTVSSVKNPTVKSLLDRILGNQSQNVGMDGNPFQLYRNTKDQAQQGRISQAGQTFDQSKQANRGTLSDFTSKFLGQGQQQADQFTGEEVGAIGGFYNGQVAGDLNTLANQRQMAVQRAMDRALGRARGGLNSQRLQYGDSSSLNSQYLKTLSDVMSEEARQQADLGRTNYLTVKDAQTALAGRRMGLTDAALGRSLVPIQANTQLSAAELAQLGQLGQLNDQNSVYNVDTPDARIGRQLGTLGQAVGIDQANSFYGLTQPYQPDFSGFNNVNPYRPSQFPGQPFSQPQYAPQQAYDPFYGNPAGAQPPVRPQQAMPSYQPVGYAGQGTYAVRPDGSVNMGGQFDYGQALLNNGRPNPFYQPGWDQASYDRQQSLYE